MLPSDNRGQGNPFWGDHVKSGTNKQDTINGATEETVTQPLVSRTAPKLSRGDACHGKRQEHVLWQTRLATGKVLVLLGLRVLEIAPHHPFWFPFRGSLALFPKDA